MKSVVTATLLLVFTAAVSSLSAQEAEPLPKSVPEGTRLHRDLAYVENGHERQKLDLYLPPASAVKSWRPLPLIIWIHGGAFREGWKGGDFRALPFLKEGYAVASLNYRLSQHALFPACVQDCRTAVRWLRSHAGDYQLDPDRFAAWGESAGGYLSAMLGVCGDSSDFDTGALPGISSRVQAVVDFYGPTDFAVMDEQDKDIPGNFSHDAADSPESQLIGGPVQENPEKVRLANPITYITKEDPPFLIVHGDRDRYVPYGQSVIFNKALRQAGVSVKFHTVKGAGHGDGFGDAEQRAAAAFLKKELKPGT